MIRKPVILTLAVLLLGATLPADAAPKKEKEYPVYWIDVTTENQGIPGMGGGGFLAGFLGKKLMGPRKELLLRVVSPHRTPEPQGAHVVPEAFRGGPRLPLVTPVEEKGERQPAEERTTPEGFEPPKGKILLYWGCGETVRKGQPKVIDLSDVKGSAGSASARLLSGRLPTRQHPPSPRPGWIYARWPEGSRSSDISSDASLVGDHRVEAGYLPVPIAFSLSEKQDFMAPLEFEPVTRGKNGSLTISWKPVPTAAAYFATAMGHDEKKGETILWSSSEVMEGGFGLLDYLTPQDVTKYVKEKVVLPPTATTCAIPPVFPPDGGAVLSMIAYGSEVNLSHPPKPKDPKKRWDLEWSVKIRYKSTALLPLMVTGDDGDETKGKKGGGRKDTPPVTGEGGLGDAIRGIFGW